MTRPQGAFYLFLDFSAHQGTLGSRGVETCRDLCRVLLEETGVALLPGCDFGRPEQELTARLSYVDFEGEQALAAAADLDEDCTIDGEFLRSHCTRVLEGVARIAEWVSAA